MSPLIFWHWNTIPSLREIDDKIKDFAGRGFGSAVILAEDGFLSSRFFEALKGACRSAYRYDFRIYSGGDTGPFSGHGGGEVASVPGFRARALCLVPEKELAEGEEPLLVRNGQAAVLRRAEKKNGICPTDVFDPQTVQCYIDSVCRRLKRELSGFMGKEFKGIFLRRAIYPEFWEVPALPWSERLSEPSPELLFGSEQGREEYLAMADELCTTMFFSRIGEWCAENGIELIAEPDCGAAKSVASISVPSGGTDFYTSAFRGLGLAIAQGAGLISAEGAVAASPWRSEPDGMWAAAADRLTGVMVGENVDGLKAEGDNTEEIISVGRRSGERAAYLFVNTGDSAVSARFTVPDDRPACLLDVVAGERFSLPKAGELEAELWPGGLLVLECGGAAGESLPDHTRCGVVIKPMGEALKLETELVEGAGLHDEALLYQVRLPDELESGSLLLEGSFAAARVKIGRRKELLCLKPFLLPIYAADGGRTAEIEIYCTADNAATMAEFQLNNVSVI